MEVVFHRLLLVGTFTVITLHFPELIAWSRITRISGVPDTAVIGRALTLLRKLLRIEFFFYIVLLAYSLYHPAPYRLLVYPLVLFHLAGLIIGERDLPSELHNSRGLLLFVRFLIFADVLEIVLLSIIALQLHGVVTF
jgi:hypothetical protein